jgi:hypothetical protein
MATSTDAPRFGGGSFRTWGAGGTVQQSSIQPALADGLTEVRMLRGDLGYRYGPRQRWPSQLWLPSEFLSRACTNRLEARADWLEDQLLARAGGAYAGRPESGSSLAAPAAAQGVLGPAHPADRVRHPARAVVKTFWGALPNFNELTCANLPNCERSASYWRRATNEFAAHRDQTKILGANVIREPPGSRTSPNSRSRYAASWGYTLWLARYYRSRPRLRPSSRPSVPHARPRMRYTR